MHRWYAAVMRPAVRIGMPSVFVQKRYEAASYRLPYAALGGSTDPAVRQLAMNASTASYCSTRISL